MKDNQLRILNCTILLLDNKPELELNKTFNFEEISKAKKIFQLLKQENSFLDLTNDEIISIN